MSISVPVTKWTNFRTPYGITVPSVSAEQMREIDRIATMERGPNLFQMMEHAGRSTAEVLIHLLGNGWRKPKILVLAGSGGNGGGGLCAARHLVNRGAEVGFVVPSAARLSDVTRQQLELLELTDADSIAVADLSRMRYDVIIDALIGYGLSSAPRDPVKRLIDFIENSDSAVLSLDLPSGVDATTGETSGSCVTADWTVTLALPKHGLSNAVIGELFLADIGIPSSIFRRVGIDYIEPFAGKFWTKLERV